MPETPDISEWDLLAYADGRLEPERARRVEAALAADPALGRKIDDFAHQNAALAAQYGAYAEAPLPERLARLLDDGPRRQTPATVHLRRAAAMLVAVLGAGAAGWWLGGAGGAGGDRALERFLNEAALMHQRAEDHHVGAVDLANAPDGRPLNWFSDRISLELKIPDLRDEGYALVDKRRLRLDEGKGVYLRYVSEDAGPLAVFLRSRWARGPSSIDTTRRDGVSLAYWLDGPVSVVVASDAKGPGPQIGGLAAMLRARLHDRNDGTGGELAPHRGHDGTRETVLPAPEARQIGDVTGGDTGRAGNVSLDQPLLDTQR